MLTSERVRPSYRPYRVVVSGVRRLSETFTRVTFSGDDLDVFGTDGLDQRIKLMLPLADGTISDIGIDDEQALAEGTWYAQWRDLPHDRRNPIRTYTVRAIRPELREVDVDFVCHGDSGPASAWVGRAGVGDSLVLVGPDSRSPRSTDGIEFKPGSAARILLAGDETAVPAVTSILESLPAGARAHAILEVPHTDDALPVMVGEGVTIQWLARGHRATGDLLSAAVRDWYTAECVPTEADAIELIGLDAEVDALWEVPVDEPTDDLYVWIAGESSMVKQVRRYLVRDCGVHRRQVAFMGYWRRGLAEAS